MGFEVAARDYDRFMGRYSQPLAPVFADFANVRGAGASAQVLDVGCGPGALTRVLIDRLGAAAVSAVDPSASFTTAMIDLHPDVDVRHAGADALPHPDGTFTAALAQLVVHFMPDPVAGLREMARTVTDGGTVAACVWDFHEGGSPLSQFWSAAMAADPQAPGEESLPGTRRGHLGELLSQAGLTDVSTAKLSVSVSHETFEDWWAPFELGVGPAGSYVVSLDARQRAAVRRACEAQMGPAPFTVRAEAWAARGIVAGSR